MIEKAIQVKRALVSVHDKTGVVALCQTLKELGVEILSTGGTAKLFKENNIPVIDVSDYTQFPEMLAGRVKTLHPKVHAGILYRREFAEDVETIEKHGISGIDLVVVNLYPFQEVSRRKGATLEEVVENIDIGGPTMVRAAAKNYAHVGVVCDSGDYANVAEELKQSKGMLSFDTREKLMLKAFETTAEYDASVSSYFQNSRGIALPSSVTRTMYKAYDLRYGENPHQDAALYTRMTGLAQAKLLAGKEMSYNNWLDAYSAYRIAREFEEPVAVIIKHNNPCGGAVGQSLAEALEKALKTDPTSAFGGVYAFNGKVDVAVANVLTDWFVEVIVAKGFDEDALRILSEKKNRRLLDATEVWEAKLPHEFHSIGGSVLVQDADTLLYKEVKQVTKRKPNQDEKEDMDFAWRFCKHTKSNAIVFAKNKQLVGVGAGQMSRVDSVRLAVMKAKEAKLSAKGAVMASDAFFPFPDGIQEAAKAGITAVMQPGGSLRDDEVIKAADELGLAMLFTGMRHFRH
ncbi:bifunctional phosphoribosylaminoimidazolecarboxamide formyltransferase/IMP cyclohydrolase [Candidatus Micrarchaeota archaeon]|nr:bifunctional phosphoribosylaminoimidazolecarboxamide formyltransferase/IMP cyclohydrolase [Candidatus Micrarchaeota archaeon]